MENSEKAVPQRSNTQTTVASALGASPIKDVANGDPGPSASTYGMGMTPAAAPSVSQRVREAYHYAENLKCITLGDALLALVNAVAFQPLWSLLCLTFIPFAIVGRIAAGQFRTGPLLLVYMGYCLGAVIGRVVLAVFYGVWNQPGGVLFEVASIFLQLWFLYVAYEYRKVVSFLTADEQSRLAQGRIAVARTETLVYV